MTERVQDQQPQLDEGTKARMVELGFDVEKITTGDVGEVINSSSPDKETDYGNERAEVMAALHAVGRSEEVVEWMIEQMSGSQT